MSELIPCPFCGGTKICTEKGINLNYCDNCSAESNVEHWNTRPIEDALNARIAELEATVEVGADIAKAYENRVSEIVALSNETVGKLNSRIAELEGIIKSDDERLTEAGLKVNLYFGCDTAEIMAEEILSSRARIAELEAVVDELVNIGDNLFDSLNPIAWKHEWLDKWWKLSNCRRGERE